MSETDWTNFDRESFPKSRCYCRCGATFSSHAKYTFSAGLVVRDACPGCGSHRELHRIDTPSAPSDHDEVI